MGKIDKKFKSKGLAGIAFGVTVGASMGEFLNSIIDQLLMPIVAFFVAEDHWQTDTLAIGEIYLRWGQVVADAIHLAIVSICIYFLIDILEEKKEPNEDDSSRK